MSKITRIGFGQVEPNHLSAQRTGQIYAQLPATGMNILENGQFVKYNLAEGKVDLTGAGEFMLVYNEIKLYDVREYTKDFALKLSNESGDAITPRVFKTNIGDIYTTNCIEVANTSNTATVESAEIAEKDFLEVDAATGYLKKSDDTNAATMLWQVSKLTTMPDGQIAVKIVRTK